MCINKDSAVINNTYGRVGDLILFFKILVGTQKNFLEIYSQFGRAPLESFTSPFIGYLYILFARAL
jgi:hypothetical protein